MINYNTQPLSDTIGILDVSISDPDGTYEVKYLDRSEVEREISIEFAEIDDKFESQEIRHFMVDDISEMEVNEDGMLEYSIKPLLCRDEFLNTFKDAIKDIVKIYLTDSKPLLK